MAFAVVAVDVRGLRSAGFHYRIPPRLEERARPGMRVTVPLGPREVTGVIVALDHQCPVTGVRDIKSVLDEEPVYEEGLLGLAREVSRYYAAPLASVLWTMLPAVIRYRGRTVYALAPGRPEVEPRGLSSAGARVLEVLAEHGAMTQPELEQSTGAGRAELARLMALELVQRHTSFSPGARSRRQVFAELAVPDHQALQAAEGEAKRAPRRAELLRRLVEAGGKVPAQGTSRPVLDRLSGQGLVRLVESELPRRPAPGMKDPVVSFVPTAEQAFVLQSIIDLHRRKPGVCLLHGVTGSGKTEVYLRFIGEVLEEGRQAIVLVPEISLTPQTLGRFQERFGDQVAVLHSALSTGERYDEWQRVQGGRARVIVGARSAVFAPARHLGAIIVDEEHEYSYKQEESPRYHAREVAIMRAFQHRATVVLGSATPSLESYTRAASGEYQLLTLSHRVDGAELPPVTVVDMRAEMKAGNRSMFSRELGEALEQVVQKGARAMLFLNRRGFASFVLCRECGLVIQCPQCDVSLTLHRQGRELRCHYCDFKQHTPDTCPVCQSRYIRGFGAGTERVESEVQRSLPNTRVLRMDSDTTARRGAHQRILEEFRSTPGAVLVGTQMIAKGLDIPGVELVGVVTADTGLNFPDFRSAERTFQLLTQVAGRSGRGGPGRVLVQTYHPDHYAIQAAASHDYGGFYRQELAWREQAGFPPFTHLVHLVFSSPDEEAVARAAHRAAAGEPVPGVRVLGPAPAPLSRLHGSYRWQVLLAGRDRDALLELALRVQEAHEGQKVRLAVDPDPVFMM